MERQGLSKCRQEAEGCVKCGQGTEGYAKCGKGQRVMPNVDVCFERCMYSYLNLPYKINTVYLSTLLEFIILHRAVKVMGWVSADL